MKSESDRRKLTEFVSEGGEGVFALGGGSGLFPKGKKYFLSFRYLVLF